MSPTRWTVVCLVVVTTALLSVAMAVTAGGVGEQDRPAFQTDIDADSTEMAATVGPDGDATWRVTYRLELEGNESVQAFEALQADIRANESAYLGPFADRMRRTADTAATATRREMAIRNLSITTQRTAQPDAEFGEVVFAFTWVGFAAVEDGTVRVGDAVDGLFLDEESSLTLGWTDELRVESQAPRADTTTERRVTWRGPLEFEAGEPRVTVVSDAESGGPGGVPPTVLLVAGLLVAAGVGVAVYLRGDDGEATPTANTDTEEQATTDSQEPPSELLSNEERVLTLVEENGGRIKQKEVADQLDWSAAMTSQVVGDLREADEIETFRIGRENVLTLPEVDIVSDEPTADDETTDER